MATKTTQHRPVDQSFYIVSSEPPKSTSRNRGKWAFLANMRKRQNFAFPKKDYNKVHAALNYAKKHYDATFHTERDNENPEVYYAIRD
jgi:hypothetical protein